MHRVRWESNVMAQVLADVTDVGQTSNPFGNCADSSPGLCCRQWANFKPALGTGFMLAIHIPCVVLCSHAYAASATKRHTFTLCWFNAGPSSQTSTQRYTNRCSGSVVLLGGGMAQLGTSYGLHCSHEKDVSYQLQNTEYQTTDEHHWQQYSVRTLWQQQLVGRDINIFGRSIWLNLNIPSLKKYSIPDNSYSVVGTC